MWKLEGCVGENKCIEKKCQMVFNGIHIEDEIVQEFIYGLYDFLHGKRDMNRKEVENFVKKILLFGKDDLFPKPSDEKENSIFTVIKCLREVWLGLNLTGYFLYPNFLNPCDYVPDKRNPDSCYMEFYGYVRSINFFIPINRDCICSCKFSTGPEVYSSDPSAGDPPEIIYDILTRVRLNGRDNVDQLEANVKSMIQDKKY